MADRLGIGVDGARTGFVERYIKLYDAEATELTARPARESSPQLCCVRPMFTTAFRNARSAISAAALGRRPALVGSAERSGHASRRRRRFPKVSAGDTRSAAFRTIARTLWLNCSASTLMPSTYRELERH